MVSKSVIVSKSANIWLEKVMLAIGELSNSVELLTISSEVEGTFMVRSCRLLKCSANALEIC